MLFKRSPSRVLRKGVRPHSDLVANRVIQLTLSPRTVLITLLIAIGFLLFMHVMGNVSKYVFGHGYVFGLIDLFQLGLEENVPTLFSSFQLIVAGLLLALIGVAHKANGESYSYWLALSLTFFFLAVDETAQIHERFNALRGTFQLTGFFYFAWVVPYAVGMIIFLAVFSKFLLRLPARTARLFVASGAIYLVGAMGLEMLGAKYSYVTIRSLGSLDLPYLILVTIEEMLELLGIAIFIYALLDYISETSESLDIAIR